MAMKLCQGQVWKKGGEYIRIVRLERLEVEYNQPPWTSFYLGHDMKPAPKPNIVLVTPN